MIHVFPDGLRAFHGWFGSQDSTAEADVRALRSIMTALCRRCGTLRTFGGLDTLVGSNLGFAHEPPRSIVEQPQFDLMRIRTPYYVTQNPTRNQKMTFRI